MNTLLYSHIPTLSQAWNKRASC